MNEDLDFVSIKICDYGAVVVRMILGVSGRGSLPFTASGERGGIEAVDRCAIRTRKGEVGTPRGPGRVLVGGALNPELSAALTKGNRLRCEVVHTAVPESAENGIVERRRPLDILHADGRVVEH